MEGSSIVIFGVVGVYFMVAAGLGLFMTRYIKRRRTFSSAAIPSTNG